MSQASVVAGRTGRHSTALGVMVILAVTLSSSDPAPPEPEVASIELSVPLTGTAIRFRDPLIVRAAPQAALGVPLERVVTWTSVTPSFLSVQPLAPEGDSARIRATGVGTGQIRVSAGEISQTFDVTVQDTVFSVSLTPSALALVSGDTVTYRATVSAPPNADRTIRWDVVNATGQSTVEASGGTATFPNVALSTRCPSIFLTATATPPAAPTTSQAFSVTARGCNAVAPFMVTDTIHATMESADCVVARGGKSFYAHIYELTIPSSAGAAGFNFAATSSAFAPVIESTLWPQDPAVSWADSSNTAGSVNIGFWLPPGTHRFVVHSPSPGGTGPYLWMSSFVIDLQVPLLGTVRGCLIRTAPGITIPFSSLTADDGCSRPFVSRSGDSPGRQFLLYLAPNRPTQVTYRPTGSAVGNDAYLELFDVTHTSELSATNLIGFDDNSGGGEVGLDAQYTVQPSPNGRFILIRAARLLRAGGGGTSQFTLTITG